MFKFGVFFVSNNGQKLELFEKAFNIADARKKLAYQLNLLSNNENQATANTADGFHFFVKNEGSDYAEEKRAMFISRIYQGEKQNLMTASTARELAEEKFNFEDLYFRFESLEYAM
jgi:hypothetical protein